MPRRWQHRYHVTTGDMSRGWKDSEAGTAMATPTLRQHRCHHGERHHDELSVVMKKGGAADQCVTDMKPSGPTRFPHWREEDLANHEEGGLDTPRPTNDGDGVREGRPPQPRPARPRGQTQSADSDSGTYEYFGEQVFCKKCFADADPVAEGFDSAAATKTPLRRQSNCQRPHQRRTRH